MVGFPRPRGAHFTILAECFPHYSNISLLECSRLFFSSHCSTSLRRSPKAPVSAKQSTSPNLEHEAMADPLSVSASIAGLKTVTDAVFRWTSKYVKAVEGAPNEVSSLTLALGALFGILHNLRLVASQLEGKPFDTAIQVNQICSCIETMEKVENFFYCDYKISYNAGSSVHSWFSRVLTCCTG